MIRKYSNHTLKTNQRPLLSHSHQDYCKISYETKYCITKQGSNIEPHKHWEQQVTINKQQQNHRLRTDSGYLASCSTKGCDYLIFCRKVDTTKPSLVKMLFGGLNAFTGPRKLIYLFLDIAHGLTDIGLSTSYSFVVRHC